MEFSRILFAVVFFGPAVVAVVAPIASWIVLSKRRGAMRRRGARSPHPLRSILAAALAWCALAVAAIYASIWLGFFYAWASAHLWETEPRQEHPPLSLLFMGIGVLLLLCGSAFGLHRFIAHRYGRQTASLPQPAPPAASQ